MTRSFSGAVLAALSVITIGAAPSAHLTQKALIRSMALQQGLWFTEGELEAADYSPTTGADPAKAAKIHEIVGRTMITHDCIDTDPSPGAIHLPGFKAN